MYNRFPRDGQDFLASYKGPYPLYQLKNARDTLIYGFNICNSRTFYRINQLMCMESYSNNINHEYSEDNYTESESDNESKLMLNKMIKFNDESSGVESVVTTQQESKVKMKCEQLKGVAESQNTEVSEKTFYSTEGFKNRFAEYLYGKTTVDVFNGDEEKNLKRKSPDIKINGLNAEDNETPVANNDFELDCVPSSKKIAKTNLDSFFNEDALIQCFKCDYCEFTSAKAEEMCSHLNSLKHRSGSKCLGQLENGNISPWYTMEEMYVQSEEKHCTQIATCPTCFKIFPNIYVCATHSQQCFATSGKQQNGLYAISEVVRNTEILVPVDSVCQVCKLRCSKHRALNLHYEARKHYPFDKPDSPDVLLSFLCPFCEKDFDSFFPAKAHVITHVVKYPRVSMALQLFYYKKTSVGKRLLPVKRSLPNKKAKRKRPFRKYFRRFPQKTKKVPNFK